MAEIIIIALIVVILLGLVLGRQPFTPPITQPSTAADHAGYALAPSLFVNKSEQAFYTALTRTLPPPYAVHAKVRLEDVVGVRPDIKDPKLRWSLRGRVKSRHVDFLIIDAQGRPYVAIELDGRIHDNKTAENADALKDGIFRACALPLERVRTGENFQARIVKIVNSLK